MKKITALLVLITMVISTVFFACKKQDISGGGLFDAGNTVNATIKGRVTDNQGKPVPNALVTAGTSTTTTDVDGRFIVRNAALYKNAGYIKITKTGYFNGSRTILVNTSAVNYIEVQLIKKTVSGTFAASAGGDINPSNGGKISFSPGSIINETTGSTYSGNVSVSAFFLNPSDNNFNSYMPGDLRGINSSSQDRILQSFGMMAVELNGAAGEKLQLGSGKTATLTFPIPSAMLASAPASIPLWYFDETKGLWKEEGVANKVGNNYVGTVAHFSYWNCDVPAQYVSFTAQLKDQNGNPLSFTNTSITSTTFGTRYGWTDSSGIVSGLIPANESLVFKVYDRCGNVLHTQNIGPYSTNANAGVITVNTSSPSSVTITGTVTNCAGTAVTNGFVQVNLDNLYFNAPVNNGNFSLTVSRCNSNPVTASITAVDVANGQQGNTITTVVSTGTANVGQLTACGTSTAQYINIDLNGTTYSWVLPTDSINVYAGLNGANQGTTILGYGFNTTPNNYRSIQFSFNGNTTGTYALNPFNLSISSGSSFQQWVSNGNMTTSVTEYGPTGQFIVGTFSGTVRDSSNVSVTAPVSGNYRVKRWF